MTTHSHRIPVLALACTLFVVTTSEFQVAAMLTDMADDLHRPVADLALLVTAYSLGSALGGPVLARAAQGTPPRVALIGVVTAYALAEAAASLMPHLAGLMAFRCLTGALSGATFGLTLTTGMALVDDSHQPRAVSTILAGLMAGTLLGLPLSHLLSLWAGWRASFVALGVAAALMALCLAVALPASTSAGAHTDAGLSRLASPALWTRFAASFLTIGGAFAAFALIDPLLAQAGLSGGAATLVMTGFGLAAFVSNHLSGRAAPGRAGRWLLAGLAVQLAALVLLASMPHSTPAVTLALVALGATGMALNPLLVNRVVTVANPSALVNTIHTSCITLGVAAATALGSRVIAAGSGLQGAVLVGAGLTLAAGLVVAATPDRRARAPRSPATRP
ncbi:MFS transporter [Kytococcus sp. Marseille-QA3725]